MVGTSVWSKKDITKTWNIEILYDKNINDDGYLIIY